MKPLTVAIIVDGFINLIAAVIPDFFGSPVTFTTLITIKCITEGLVSLYATHTDTHPCMHTYTHVAHNYAHSHHVRTLHAYTHRMNTCASRRTYTHLHTYTHM